MLQKACQTALQIRSCWTAEECVLVISPSVFLLGTELSRLSPLIFFSQGQKKAQTEDKEDRHTLQEKSKVLLPAVIIIILSESITFFQFGTKHTVFVTRLCAVPEKGPASGRSVRNNRSSINNSMDLSLGREQENYKCLRSFKKSFKAYHHC